MDSRPKFSTEVAAVIHDDIQRYCEMPFEGAATEELVAFALGVTPDNIRDSETFETAILHHCVTLCTDEALRRSLATITVDGRAHYEVDDPNLVFTYAASSFTRGQVEGIRNILNVAYPSIFYLHSLDRVMINGTPVAGISIAVDRKDYVNTLLKAIVNSRTLSEEKKESIPAPAKVSTPSPASLFEETKPAPSNITPDPQEEKQSTLRRWDAVAFSLFSNRSRSRDEEKIEERAHKEGTPKSP